MESQDKEKEYERNIREIYRKEFATANREKRLQLNKRMHRWQELMKSGRTPSQAYYKVMEEPQETPPNYPFWTKMRKALVVIPVLALAAAIVYGIVITGEIDTLKTELDSVQNVLTSTQSDLTTTKQTLVSVQLELGSTKETLASTQLELGSTKETLTSTQSELSSTTQTLASTQSDLSATKQTLASTQQQLAVAQETLGGLGITLSTSKECSDVVLIDNPAATNPTWSQLMTFLSQDQTEKHTYIKDVYDCSQFSRDVHNNAEEAGIRAAEVHVEFRNEVEGHALNAFITTDRGFVYVDCTGEGLHAVTFESWLHEKDYPIEWDKLAYVDVGKKYGLLSLDVAISPEYSFYEIYQAKRIEYENKLEAYNQEVETYNQALGGRVYLEEPEYSRFKAWYNRLDSMAAELEALLEELRGFSWESLGVVSKIEIYW